MRYLVFLTITIALSACATTQNFQHFSGGDKIDQPGYLFQLPIERPWTVLIRSDYQVVLGANEKENFENILINIITYQIPSFSTKTDYLKFISSANDNVPETGHLETIKREEELFKGRSETCVKYEFASKDLSKGAVRAGGYTVMQNYGMHCIHPLNNAVGITIDISRKAPPHIPSSKFDDIGERLLKSVSFVGFLE